MNTFYSNMKDGLTSRGMFPSQAEKVMDGYINSKESAHMDRWNDNPSEYPPVMTNILWSGVKKYAAKWIAENAPEAWFRPMFELTTEQLEEMMMKSKEESA